MPTLYLADFIAPMTGPVLADGFVLVNADRIEAVGARSYLPRLSAERIPLRGLLTPGLINAHTHTNLSTLAGKIAPMGLWDWLLELIRLRREMRTAAGGDAEEQAGVVTAVRQAIHHGTTTLADMHYLPAIREVLQQLPVRQIACCEYLSTVPRLCAADWLPECTGPRWRSSRSLPAPAPHASYSVHRALFEQAGRAARDYHLPLVTHWAETADELDWLAGRDGQLMDFMQRVGSAPLMPAVPHATAGEYARQLGLFTAGALLVHGNALTDADIRLLSAAQADSRRDRTAEEEPAIPARNAPAVCYCPRSHRYFGHPAHPWRKLLDANVNVCLGTDSLASLPAGATLSPIEELRFLRREFPAVDPFTLWRLATANAAEALKLAGHLGVLEPGAQADLALWPVPAGSTPDTALASVLDMDRPPAAVYLAGARVH